MSKRIILLANLGSPDSPETKDVKTYLSEFLMDERVIDLPYLLRTILVRGMIVPFRASQSAEKYKTIWTEEGSPLITITKKLATLVQEQSHMPTYVCMRYANPSTKYALDAISKEHPDCTEVVLLPLYPHYAMSSYETAVVQVKEIYSQVNYSFKLKVVPPYYSHPSYIKALAASIKPYLSSPYDHLLFSYHGVPERHIKKGDITGKHCLNSPDCCTNKSEAHSFCYRHQVKTTMELVAKELNLQSEKYSISFQSRLGQDKWLKPSTTEKLKAFPDEGIKKLLVVCPAFVSDCLETLEEIQVEGKHDYLFSGGQTYTVIPCLNTNEQWVSTINELIKEA